MRFLSISNCPRFSLPQKLPPLLFNSDSVVNWGRVILERFRHLEIPSESLWNLSKLEWPTFQKIDQAKISSFWFFEIFWLFRRKSWIRFTQPLNYAANRKTFFRSATSSLSHFTAFESLNSKDFRTNLGILKKFLRFKKDIFLKNMVKNYVRNAMLVKIFILKMHHFLPFLKINMMHL